MFSNRFTALTVVLGILSLTVAGSAQAGGSGHTGGSFSGGSLNKFVSGSGNGTGNSNNSQSNGSKLDSQKLNVQTGRNTTATNNSSNSNNSNSSPTKIAKPIDLGKLNQVKPALDPKLLQNTKLDKNLGIGQINNKNIGKLLDNKTADAGKMKFDTKFIKEHLKDYSKDKCFHDCCHKCPWWYCWTYPTWCPLYQYGCGYWYDVPVVEVHEGIDLQLLGVRMIDSGDPEQNLGPAFRVWVRNNSHVTIVHPFNVLVLAAHGPQPTADLPQAGVRVSAIEAQQVLPVDIRLPAEANQPGLPMLHVLVDSHREIAEVFEDNNGTVLNRSDILPLEATGGAEPAATEVGTN
jgi:hypothetical protein